MKLIASAATTGSAKNTADREQRGRDEHHAGDRDAFIGPRARQHPAALLEHAVGAAVELGGRLVGRKAAAHHALGHELHLVRDALPLRHLRARAHAIELLAEGARVRIACEQRLRPSVERRGGRLPVSAWKRCCIARPRQVLDHAPRRVLVRGSGGRSTRLRAAGDGCAGARGSRQRRGHPGALAARRRQALLNSPIFHGPLM